MTQSEPTRDPREAVTAYDCRDRLPELHAWMADENMMLLPLWKRHGLEAEKEYFDLDNPSRGSFVADGTERPTDPLYVMRDDVPEDVWSQLITWKALRSDEQAHAIADVSDALSPR